MASTGGTVAAVVAGLGISLPRQSTLSSEIDTRLGKPDGWLESRCGVHARYTVSDGETQITMATAAAKMALAEAALRPGDIDLLLFGASVGYQPIPATAPLVKRELDAGDQPFPAYDVNATCLSALTAIDQATLQIAAGRIRTALIVTSEVASCALPWKTEPATAGLFGDGAAAAAIVLRADSSATNGPRIGGFHMETYSSGYDICSLRSGGTRFNIHEEPDTFARNAFFEMDGRALYRQSSAKIAGFIERLLEISGWQQDEVDLVVPHQASPIALAHIVKHCGFAADRVFNIVANFGNQVAASLPIALFKAREAGRLEPGTKIMLIGTSAGISIGGATVLV